MSIITFLKEISALETGEEQDGHASGADAIDQLDRIILAARALQADASQGALDADGRAVLRTTRDLLDEALLTHIYQDESEIEPDCSYVAAIAEADGILDLHGPT